VRECAVRAVLDHPALHFDHLTFPRAVFYSVQRAVAEQAVEVIQSLMTWKELAFSVFKKTVSDANGPDAEK